VKQLRTHDWSVWSELEAEAKFGVKMSQLGDWLALVGDAPDNIKGCQGVGEKRATAMLQTNGDWAGIVKALEEKQFTPAMTAALQGFDYATTRKLIELRRDVPINFDDLYSGRSVKPIVKLEEPPVEDVPSSVIAAEKVFGVKAETTRIAPEPETETVAIGELVDIPKPTASNDTRALTAPAPNPALQPNSVADAYWLAKAMMNSRLYTKFGNPEAILATMIRGKEMGLPVMTSLDMFHVIQGRPTLTANAIQSLAEGVPDCEYLACIESTMAQATWETKHRKHPKPTTFTYSIADAVAAGMTALEIVPPPGNGKEDRRGQWDKRRKEMLRKTAMVQLVRMVYPSAALGLYAREELTDQEEMR
jgi:hypothetical protein